MTPTLIRDRDAWQLFYVSGADFARMYPEVEAQAVTVDGVRCYPLRAIVKIRRQDDTED